MTNLKQNILTKFNIDQVSCYTIHFKKENFVKNVYKFLTVVPVCTVQNKNLNCILIVT